MKKTKLQPYFPILAIQSIQQRFVNDISINDATVDFFYYRLYHPFALNLDITIKS